MAAPVSVRTGRWVLTRRLLTGLAVAVLMLCILEIILRLLSAAIGQDWTVDPLPSAMPEEVLLRHGDGLRLCPQHYQSRDEEDRIVAFSEKPTRPRVIVIGESFVYGIRLSAEETWPARVEARLGGAVEVLNFGRVGSYASQLVPVVEASLTLDPDVIILAIGNNEHTMTTFYSGWAGRYPNVVYALSEALGGIRIYGLLYRLIVGAPQVEEMADFAHQDFDDPIDQEIYDIRRRPPNIEAIADRLTGSKVTAALGRERQLKRRVFRAILREMVEDIQSHGVQVILATLPLDMTVPPLLSGMTAGDGDEAFYRTLMRKLLAEDEFKTIQRFALEELSEEQLRTLAHYQHAKGMNLLARDRQDEAMEALRLAAEWDMVPDGTPSLNEIIRETAREHGCPLVDLARVSERYLQRPYAFFLDSVHVNAAGADIVATHIVKVLRSEMDLQ